MTTRQKTVEFHFGTDTTGLALATRRDLSAITVYLPETTRTFRSVIVEVFCRDTVTVATSITSWLIGIKLGAVAFDDVSITATLGSSEQQSYLFTRDVTSYFTTNFGAGASQTCQVGVTFGAIATINISARLLVTYDYDDAATTHVKTVRIPLESLIGNQPTSLTEVGTNQVPLLDTFLPETTKTIRMISFQVEGTEGTSALTDAQIGLSLDAGAEALDGLHENGLISSVFYRYLWRQDAMTTSAVHAFKMRTTVSTMPCPCANILLVVTYEFDPASTTILNSLVLPMSAEDSQVVLGNVVGNGLRLQVPVPLAEPGTLALVQSAIRIGVSSDAGTDMVVTSPLAPTTTRTYTMGTSGVESAAFEATHRIDVGGALPMPLALVRGDNLITMNVHSPNALNSANPCGFRAVCYLNYTSGRASGGPGAHAQTRWQMIGTMSAAANRAVSASVGLTIPETALRYISAGIEFPYNFVVGGNANVSLGLYAEPGTGEGAEDGWQTMATFIFRTDGNVMQTGVHRARSPRGFLRWTGDPDTQRMNVATARRFLWVFYGNTSQGSAYLVATYHAITYAFAGTVCGYTGSGAGITVYVHRQDTGERIGSTVTTTGGAYSFGWFDDTTVLFAVARQDGDHLGMSNLGVAA